MSENNGNGEVSATVYEFGAYNAVYALVEELKLEELVAIWDVLSGQLADLSPLGMHLRKECAAVIDERTGEVNDDDRSTGDSGSATATDPEPV